MEPWRDELYHYGILGMKWGVRRYQNPDGSYTKAGRAHYGMKPETKEKVKKAGKAAAVAGAISVAAIGAGEARKRNPEIFERTVKRGKDKEPISPVEATAMEIGKGFESAKGAAKGIETIKKKNAGAYDLSGKSNEQLKKEIDRMSLETRWTELNDKKVASGRATVEDYLDVAQKVAMTGASVATIAALIYRMKSGS